eukprot:15432370-Alexandrium_andersonii.AAC.1
MGTQRAPPSRPRPPTRCLRGGRRSRLCSDAICNLRIRNPAVRNPTVHYRLASIRPHAIVGRR